MRRFYFFLLFLFIFVISVRSQNVLIIWDDTSSYTASLRASLRAAGMSVTYSNTIESGYTGSNPSPVGFCAVIHLNGNTWTVDMPTAGQTALVSYVNNGGVYIHTEWDAYEYLYGRMANMRDLILFDRTSGTSGPMTYYDATGMSGHAILANVPSSFSFTGAANIGPLHTFSSNPATTLMTDNYGSSAVAIRSYGNGKIIGFNHAGNYLTMSTLSDANIKQLFIDAIKWGTGGASFPLFTVHPNSASKCVGQSVTFSITATGATSLQWLKNKSPISGATNSSFTISAVALSDTGSYSCLAISTCGRDTSHIAKLTINNNLTVTYSPYSRTKCTGDSIIFTISTNGTGTIHYQWRKNGTNMSADTLKTLKISNLALTHAATYTCIVSNPCVSDTSDPTVLSVYTKPVAGFSVNDSTQCQRGNSFVMNNSSTIGSGSITSYLWKFGDNKTSSLTNPTHTYDTNKTFQLRLIAISDHNCKDSVTKNIYVYPMPKTKFTINDSTQCLKGNNFVLTNSSTIYTGTLTYAWNFGDGNSTTGTGTKSHTYSSFNVFDIKLVANSNLGCSDSLIKKAYVYSMPHSSFSVNDSTQCFKGNRFILTNTSTIPAGTITKYYWNLGDSYTDTNVGPVTHSYNRNDTFKIKFITTSNQGCKDTLNARFYVFPMPSAAFTLNDSTQCLRGNNFIFSNSSAITSGTLNYRWDFGDSITTTGSGQKNHTYINYSTYTVKLVATSLLGCADTTVRHSFVYPMPSAGFNINDSTQCYNTNNFVFSSTSTIPSGSIQNYRWDYGDGWTGFGSGPVSHIFSLPNTYKVNLLVISALGCRDSINKNMAVYPMPVSSFFANSTSQCLTGNNFFFRNTSTISSGSLNNFVWQLGDGAKSFIKDSVYHSFSAYDTFTVSLKVISNQGCADSIQHDVYVRPMPVAGFTINNPAQCLTGNRFDFNNLSSLLYGSLTYRWTFGDASNSILKNPSHSYIADNNYNVKLVTTSIYGCKDSVTKPVTVYPMPRVRFNINDSSQCKIGNNFLFSNNSTINSGNLILFNWNFGDNTFSASSTTVNHTYLVNDTFFVKLVATSNQSCKDSFTRSVIVDPMPVAGYNINVPNQCLKGNLFVFTNTSAIQHGSMTYLWKFGDGGTSGFFNAIHTYGTFNNYNVKLMATSNKGCRDSIIKTVNVYPTPVVGFSINNSEQCLTGNNFIFTNSTSVAVGSLNFLWNFGDGNTGTNTNINHTYASDQKYQVTLTASSGLNCSDSVSSLVTVHPMPFASFRHTRTCLDEILQFTDLSTINFPDNISSWSWDFGDAQTSILQNPQHAYNSSGAFTVKLSITSNFGCFSTTSKSLNFVDHIPPALLSRATVENNRDILVEWVEPASVPPGAAIKSYVLERSEDFLNFTHVGTFNALTNNYLDKFMNIQNKSYIYRVRVVDTCDFQSTPSNIGKTVLMKLDDSKEYPGISWTRYLDWAMGVKEYQVQIIDKKTGQFIPLAFIPIDTSYTDFEVHLNDSENCYRIVAYREDGLYSASNERCLKTPFYLWIPNTFTPNGDENNNLFAPVGKNVLEYNMVIYDRWGLKLFSTNSLNTSWDGTYNGNLCQTGYYYYTVQVRNSNGHFKILRGRVLLMR